MAYNFPSENYGFMIVEMVRSTSLGKTEEYPEKDKVNP
jgi:hypothetical protein